MDRMRAALCEGYGPPDVVHVREIPRPAPKAGEVLIRVHGAALNSGDWRIRSLDLPPGMKLVARPMLGLRRPRNPILGMECSGTVAATGDGVTEWREGDEVFATTGLGMGCHAEYRAVKADAPIFHRPAPLSLTEAAAICFGGTTALFFLRDRAKIRPGERVLILGGSGGVGTAAVQIAKDLGAHVTATCSARNAELVRGLGADEVVDYGQKDITRSSRRFDVVMDCVGAAPWPATRDILNDGGRHLMLVGGLGEMLSFGLRRRRGAHTVLGGTAPVSRAAVEDLARLCESGAYRPVVSETFPLARIREAHALLDTGHKRGSVVILMQD